MLTPLTRAQWDIENSGTHAGLRGIHSLGGGVAWASGTDGTILRTEDAGYLWQGCATPPGAEKLDFRGIQAFDEQTAIVMSSGPGDQSRLYKTTDGCRSWYLLFTNPDKDGFWDAIRLFYSQSGKPESAWLIGDPVGGRFRIFEVPLGPSSPDPYPFRKMPKALKGESLFAASNSSLCCGRGGVFIGTGGGSGAFSLRYLSHNNSLDLDVIRFARTKVPVGSQTESSGIFSIAFAAEEHSMGVAVGGDYKAPNESHASAAFTTDGGQHWTAATTPPHGYRSAVAYDTAHKTWITVGPNGTDISRDDGRTWTALKPTAAEPPDADQHWNALSLPFVVGPDGRIGKLRSDALNPHPVPTEGVTPH